MTGMLVLLIGPLLVVVAGNWIVETCWRRPERLRRWEAFVEREKAKGPYFPLRTPEELKRMVK